MFSDKATVKTGMNGEPAGRRQDGRFGPGNTFAKGHRGHVVALRRAFVDCLNADDIGEIVAKLLELARGGDVAAIRLLLDRALGRVPSAEGALDEPQAMSPFELECQKRLLRLRISNDIAERKGSAGEPSADTTRTADG